MSLSVERLDSDSKDSESRHYRTWAQKFFPGNKNTLERHERVEKLHRRNLSWKRQIFPGKVAGYPGFLQERLLLFFCRSTLHTTFNGQYDKEGGGRRRNTTENAAANDNKQGPQSPAQEAGGRS